MPRRGGHLHIEIPQGQIADFCHHHHIRRLALFGSALREDFRSDSDVDVLVEFEPEAHHGLFDLSRMQSELEEILGREVDLIERSAIEKSRNYIWHTKGDLELGGNCLCVTMRRNCSTC